MNIISVNNISKYYLIERNKFDKLKHLFLKSFKGSKFFALTNLSFKLKKGDHLGIIGDNGSGKSTLLKILTGVTLPSNGNYSVKGKVFSILELGLGFNDNFSGKENIELSYSLYGIEKNNLKNYIENIIKFSELEKFFDRPVRTYSNGMRLRLAFAAAIFSNPNILIVDEALSVGDIDFQKKCFDKINEMKKRGTTLVYVSHDLNSVRSICSKAMLLSEGKIVAYDNADDVCNIYIKRNFKNINIIENKNNFSPLKKINTNEVFDKCNIKNIFLSSDNIKKDKFFLNEEITVNIEVSFLEDTKPTIGIMIKNKIGIEVFGINTDHLDFKLSFKKNEIKIFKFKLNNYFASGIYFLNCGLFEKNKNNFLQRNLNSLKFEVLNNRNLKSTNIAGFLNIPVKFEVIN